MSYCVLKRIGEDTCKCEQCGVTRNHVPDCSRATFHCDKHSEEYKVTHPHLGDRIESALTAIGITQDSWIAVKSAIGLPPICGCEERKEAINDAEQWMKELGTRLGESAVAAVSKIWSPIRLKKPPD